MCRDNINLSSLHRIMVLYQENPQALEGNRHIGSWWRNVLQPWVYGVVAKASPYRQWGLIFHAFFWMSHCPFLSLPLRAMHPFFLSEVSSLFSVASETLSLFAKSSLVIDGFSFIADRMACWRSFTGSFTGSLTGSFFDSFWIWRVNFTCISSGCSNRLFMQKPMRSFRTSKLTLFPLMTH